MKKFITSTLKAFEHLHFLFYINEKGHHKKRHHEKKKKNFHFYEHQKFANLSNALFFLCNLF